MTWADYVIIAIVGISLLYGLFRGFVREIVSLIVWIGGVFLLLHYLPPIESSLQGVAASIYVRYAIIIVGFLIVALFVSWLIGKIFNGLVSSVGLGFTNRFVGLLFGFVRGVIIVAFLVILLPPGDEQQVAALKNSKLMPTVQPIADKLSSVIPKDFQQRITDDIKQTFKKEVMKN